MSETHRSTSRIIRESTSPYLSIPLIIGTLLDFWSHPYSNQETDLILKILNGSEADLGRRAWISNIPEVGPELAKHLGNFGLSGAAMITVSTLGFWVKEYGKSEDNKTIETIGNIIPVLGFLGIVAINIAAEQLSPGSSQYMGDLQFGIGGAILAHVTTTGIWERAQTQWRQSLPQTSV